MWNQSGRKIAKCPHRISKKKYFIPVKVKNEFLHPSFSIFSASKSSGSAFPNFAITLINVTIVITFSATFMLVPRTKTFLEKKLDFTWKRLTLEIPNFYGKLIAVEFKELNLQFFVKSLSRSAHVDFVEFICRSVFTWNQFWWFFNVKSRLIW